MGIPTIQTALNAGEFSPDLFGRVDLDKYRKGASTMRNFFASYRGGAVSRAGTSFCGITKQGNKGQANNVPAPRNIAFQYSATQGIIIEMGQNYFRFLSNGAYVTEAATKLSMSPSKIPASSLLAMLMDIAQEMKFSSSQWRVFCRLMATHTK